MNKHLRHGGDQGQVLHGGQLDGDFRVLLGQLEADLVRVFLEKVFEEVVGLFSGGLLVYNKASAH